MIKFLLLAAFILITVVFFKLFFWVTKVIFKITIGMAEIALIVVLILILL